MRLVDLHCNWLLQYAGESTLFEPDGEYALAVARRGRLDGYLQSVATAVLVCARSSADWAARGDRWHALGSLITRYEAEFAGRLLIGQDDIPRHAESLRMGGLCYGILAIGGLDQLVREPADPDALARVFDRGVRVFQLVQSPGGPLAGSAESRDDRGLTALGRDCLSRLAELAQGASGPRAIVDLAGMSAIATAETLDWLSADTNRIDRLPVIWSRGGLGDPGLANHDNLARLSSIGGVIGLSPGLPNHDSPDALKTAIESIAAIPFQGQTGYEGIALGADLLGVEQTLPGLENTQQVATWLGKTFDRATAKMLGQGAGLRVLLRAAGG